MRFLAVSINGILDLKNFYPLAYELTAKHSIAVDVVGFRKGLEALIPVYDGLIVGSDWNQNADLVSAFNRAGKKTALLQSEGMFVDALQWYIGKVPMTDIACLWGPEHQAIFSERGYKGEMVVTGPPRFDIYYNFRPLLSKEQVYGKIGLEDINKPYVLYLGQFFPKHEFGEALYKGQIDLTKFAGETPSEYYGLIKSHPQEPRNELWFSRNDVLGSDKKDTVRVVDRGGHTEAVDVSTLMHYASAVVTFSSTAAVEAMFIGTPAAIFEGDAKSPLYDGRIATIPAIANHSELGAIISGGVDKIAYQDFMSRFLPGDVTGQYTSAAANAIAELSRRGKTLTAAAPVSTPQKPTAIPESDRQIADASSYRSVAIFAYSDTADIIIKSRPQGLSLVDLESFCIPPRSEAYKEGEYYQKLHENDNGYKVNNWLVPELPFFKDKGARHIVEIGCGNGRFLRAASEVAESVIGVDFAASPSLKDLPINVTFTQRNVVTDELPSGDLACSADVLEHFRPEDILAVVGKIHKAAAKQYHLIACYDDGHSHETIMHPGAWLALFRTYSPNYRIADIRPRRNDPKQLICVITNI